MDIQLVTDKTGHLCDRMYDLPESVVFVYSEILYLATKIHFLKNMV